MRRGIIIVEPTIMNFPMYEVLKVPEPKFSVVVPFTRWWLVDEFLKMFDRIDFFREATEVIFMNDTDNHELNFKLQEYLKTAGFMRSSVGMSMNPEPDPINLKARRQRIVDMREATKGFLTRSEYVFSIEDDTFVPPDAFMKLYAQITDPKNKGKIGFASGVEAGRHAFKIVGAWLADNVYNPTVMQTAPYEAHGIQDVDGGGMYCYITPTALYKDAIYRFEAECLGPDVMYVMDLRRRGYRATIDWDLKCQHQQNNTLLEVDSSCVSLKWEKDAKGQWVLHEPVVANI